VGWRACAPFDTNEHRAKALLAVWVGYDNGDGTLCRRQDWNHRGSLYRWLVAHFSADCRSSNRGARGSEYVIDQGGVALIAAMAPVWRRPKAGCGSASRSSRCRTTIRRLAAESNGVAEAFVKTFKRDYARSAGSATGLDQQGGVFVKSWWWRWPEKLLIALWRFVIDGVLPESAVLKPAA
jgi:hypothetical protein